jgi:hypothetical protein
VNKLLEEEIETFRPLGLFEASMTGLRKQAAEGLALQVHY